MVTPQAVDIRRSTVDLVGPAQSFGLDAVSAGLSAYVARPVRDGPWPGVVMIHEVFGLTDVIRGLADHLAGRGFVVAAPDLYSAGGGLRCLVPTFRALSRGRGRAYTDIEATRRWLLGLSETTDGVGIIGFCLGGGFALATAARGFDASAPCYGTLPPTPQVLREACPIVGSYGARDAALAGATDKLERALTAYGVPHDLKEYPDAGHRFMNDRDDLPAFTVPLQRIMGVGPNPEAAADAWGRIDSFFTTHL